MGTSTCLVVFADDDDLVRSTIAEILADAGVEVHATPSGDNVLELCIEHRPHAVLLDLNMPNVDGFEVAKRLREHVATASLRIVAFTGRGTFEAKEQAIKAGFDEVVTKPATAHALLTALHCI